MWAGADSQLFTRSGSQGLRRRFVTGDGAAGAESESGYSLSARRYVGSQDGRGRFLWRHRSLLFHRSHSSPKRRAGFTGVETSAPPEGSAPAYFSYRAGDQTSGRMVGERGVFGFSLL